MKKKFIKGFENSKKVVENLLKDKEAASKLLDQAIKKTEENRDRLMQIKDELVLLLRMLKAWITGSYRSIPWKTLVSSFAAILYFVNPMDIIPDFIAGTGFLDDISVLTFAFGLIKDDIELFRRWEKEHVHGVEVNDG